MIRNMAPLRATRQRKSAGKWSIQMTNRVSRSNPLQVLFALVALALIVSLPSPLHAQTFQTVPALSFTKAFAGAEPLPQVLTIAYTDQSTVRFSTAASTNTGGSWLSVSPAGAACCYTPLAVSAIERPSENARTKAVRYPTVELTTSPKLANSPTSCLPSLVRASTRFGISITCG